MCLTYELAIDIYNNVRKSKHGKPKIVDFRQGAYTEPGLECNSKVLRLIRIALSRKTNQIDNLNDCICRMWIRSDIQVRKAIPNKQCLKKSEASSTTSFRFQGQLPLVSLADYYIRDLVSE